MEMVKRHMRVAFILLVALAAVLVLMARGADKAAADPGTAGHDLLETDSTQTYQDLSLPPGFFGPGCDPFVGRVALQGVPFNSFGIFSGLRPTDTIIKRIDPAGPVFPDTIDIEIVRLELVSVAPLVVTCSGVPQLWQMKAQVPGPTIGTCPPVQPLGSMTIRHEFPDGGTFDSTLHVVPCLTFTRLDAAGVIGPFAGPQIDFSTNNVRWCHTANPLTNPPGHIVVEVPGLTTNFFPGIVCESGTKSKTLTPEEAQNAKHGVLPAEVTPTPTPRPVGGTTDLVAGARDASGAPADGSGLSTGAYAAMAGVAGAVLALTTGGWYMRRRRLR